MDTTTIKSEPLSSANNNSFILYTDVDRAWNTLADYSSEKERLKTFTNWPLQFSLAEKLANDGFIYLQFNDNVKCVYCTGTVFNWLATESQPHEIHRKYFSYCPFVRNCSYVKNIPYLSRKPDSTSNNEKNPKDVEERSETLLPNCDDKLENEGLEGRDSQSLGIVTNVFNNDGELVDFTDTESMDRIMYRYFEEMFSGPEKGNTTPRKLAEVKRYYARKNPVHLRYANFDARMKSFNTWSTALPQKSEGLAEAGFYYSRFSDHVRCFFCDGGLRNWTAEDDPWSEHARWFGNCKFVIQNKGIDFVNGLYWIRNNNPENAILYKDII